MSVKRDVVVIALAASILAIGGSSAFASNPQDHNLAAMQAQAAKEEPFANKPSAKVNQGESLRITASAVSLTVDNVAASSAFLVKHFGFHENM